MQGMRTTWQEIVRFMNGMDGAALPAAVRPLLRFARPFVLAVRKFRRDRCFEQAAGLSFVTIVSLIPVGVLLVFFMKALGFQADWEDLKQSLLQNIAEGTFKQSFAGWLGEVEKDPLSSRTGTPLFVFAVGALIFAAVWLLEASEKGLNAIWQTTRKRSHVQRFMVFWSIVTASPFLLAVSSFLKNQFENSLYIAPLIQDNVFFRTFYGLCLPVLVATFAFFFVYLLLPATKVKLKAALAGAVLAGLFWEIAKAWMSYFIPHAVTISLYGSLGAIAAFFVWIYVTWAVLLLGAQLSFIIQNPRETYNLLSRRTTPFQAPPGLIAAGVALEIARASANGAKTPTLDDLAEQWSYPRDAIANAIEGLVPAYFHPSLADEDMYYLSRDSDRILLRELLGVGFEAVGRDHDRFACDAIRDLLAALDKGMLQTLGDATVRDLLDRKLSLHRSDKAQHA